MIKKLLYLLLILFSLLLLNLFVFKNNGGFLFSSQKIYAEDDEEDEEEDEEKEDEDERYEEIIVETMTEQIDIPENIVGTTIIETVDLVESGYNVDTDGDKLVDALDPDPNMPQWEFYTDDDNDTVPNAKDKYKNEDDLLYIDFIDENKNGIIDFFETY